MIVDFTRNYLPSVIVMGCVVVGSSEIVGVIVVVLLNVAATTRKLRNLCRNFAKKDDNINLPPENSILNPRFVTL